MADEAPAEARGQGSGGEESSSNYIMLRYDLRVKIVQSALALIVLAAVRIRRLWASGAVLKAEVRRSHVGFCPSCLLFGRFVDMCEVPVATGVCSEF